MRSHEAIRAALKPDESTLPLEHTIDPGFVNARRIETIVGDAGRAAIDQTVRALPDMPDWQRTVRIRRIYSDVMLAFCRVHGVPPLEHVVASRKGTLFCSTEPVGPCPDYGEC